MRLEPSDGRRVRPAREVDVNHMAIAVEQLFRRPSSPDLMRSLSDDENYEGSVAIQTA